MNKFICFIFCICLSICSCYSKELLRDTFIEENLSTLDVEPPQTHLEYDYSDTDCVKIPLRITEKITTSLKNKSYESQKLNFTVDKDVYYNNEIIVKKGTNATAKIEIITTRGLAGVPAEIFINDIKIQGLKCENIMEPVSKRGFSTTTLILPVKWALTPLPPFGSLTNLAVGFNAKLTPKQTLNVYYYPNY